MLVGPSGELLSTLQARLAAPLVAWVDQPEIQSTLPLSPLRLPIFFLTSAVGPGYISIGIAADAGR